MIVELELPFLPPSENSAYVQIGRMRKLSTEGKEFKRQVNEYCWDIYESELDRLCEELGDTLWLLVDMDIYLPLDKVVYLGWTKKNKAGARGAKEPYRNIDGHNCVKLMADALSEILHIDDRRFQWGRTLKHVDGREPRVVLRMGPVDPQEFGVPLEFTTS